MEASTTATKPNIFAGFTSVTSISLGPAAMSAPTIITDEIAFVTLIKGECSAGVTFHIT